MSLKNAIFLNIFLIQEYVLKIPPNKIWKKILLKRKKSYYKKGNSTRMWKIFTKSRKLHQKILQKSRHVTFW